MSAGISDGIRRRSEHLAGARERLGLDAISRETRNSVQADWVSQTPSISSVSLRLGVKLLNVRNSFLS